MVRCPQCGTEFERGSVQFCPNPSCGYAVSFMEQATEEIRPDHMERRPDEDAVPPSDVTVVQPPAPPALQPSPQPPLPPPEPPAPRRRRTWFFVVVCAAALLVLGVGAIALLNKGPNANPSRSQSRASPSPSAAIDLSTLRWTKVVGAGAASLGGSLDQVVNRVETGGPGLVAVGYATDANGHDVAAVWESKGGRSWTRVVAGSSVFTDPGGTAVISGVASRGGLVVAGG